MNPYRTRQEFIYSRVRVSVSLLCIADCFAATVAAPAEAAAAAVAEAAAAAAAAAVAVAAAVSPAEVAVSPAEVKVTVSVSVRYVSVLQVYSAVPYGKRRRGKLHKFYKCDGVCLTTEKMVKYTDTAAGISNSWISRGRIVLWSKDDEENSSKDSFGWTVVEKCNNKL
jgi:hypothetical protein